MLRFLNFCMICLLTVAFMSLGYAQEAAEVPGSVSSVGDAILKFIESAGGASVAIALGLEFVFRLFPSKKPIGVIRSVIVSGKYICHVLVVLLEFVDKVLPQNSIEKPEVKGILKK